MVGVLAHYRSNQTNGEESKGQYIEKWLQNSIKWTLAHQSSTISRKTAPVQAISQPFKKLKKSVKVVLKGKTTQRALASACALHPLPKYMPLISKGQRGSPTEVRGSPEVRRRGSSAELQKIMREWSKATMDKSRVEME
ncbi:uncharacterized protein EDB91DRAFT_1252213 [Suillus paluster]|uniref:uncharacterized protein n=1 Tax=Suillus paluster TaxID=48578 RepID=UPI001B8637A6|nr:uncharacterized protein EDB91DRAFT_1252213 [Suillus paluster]KAG1731342.1 hypothetical protein EDB91DRAFT_1252213 [Suillus paluster]